MRLVTWFASKLIVELRLILIMMESMLNDYVKEMSNFYVEHLAFHVRLWRNLKLKSRAPHHKHTNISDTDAVIVTICGVCFAVCSTWRMWRFFVCVLKSKWKLFSFGVCAKPFSRNFDIRVNMTFESQQSSLVHSFKVFYHILLIG